MSNMRKPNALRVRTMRSAVKQYGDSATIENRPDSDRPYRWRINVTEGIETKAVLFATSLQNLYEKLHKGGN